MEKIVSNPGLQHLAVIIFLNLEVEYLKISRQINKTCKQILNNPMFWLRKFRFLSKVSLTNWVNIIQSVNERYKKIIISYLQWNLEKEVEVVDLPYFWFKKFRNLSRNNQRDWMKVIESERNPGKETAIMSYLLWHLKQDTLVDLPCYSNLAVQEQLRERISVSSKKWDSGPSDEEDTEIVKILAPLTDNPNAPDEYGATPIFWAAFYGYIEIVKILVPLTDNPNAPNKHGKTPSSVTNNVEIKRLLESYK